MTGFNGPEDVALAVEEAVKTMQNQSLNRGIIEASTRSPAENFEGEKIELPVRNL